MRYKHKPTTWTKQTVMEEVDHLLAVACNTDVGTREPDKWLLLHGAIAALEVCQAIVSNGGYDMTPDADTVCDLSLKLSIWRDVYHELVDEGRFDG